MKSLDHKPVLSRRRAVLEIRHNCNEVPVLQITCKVDVVQRKPERLLALCKLVRPDSILVDCVNMPVLRQLAPDPDRAHVRVGVVVRNQPFHNRVRRHRLWVQSHPNQPRLELQLPPQRLRQLVVVDRARIPCRARRRILVTSRRRYVPTIRRRLCSRLLLPAHPLSPCAFQRACTISSCNRANLRSRRPNDRWTHSSLSPQRKRPFASRGPHQPPARTPQH
mmetsp:Transcript_15708/g.33961  ORF Transcript_15708/g.33961 Transcript_15708/m.33961 type:complete len:222 (+) Transcript_15708:162-827(+)